jgi:hypothetical protein
MQAARPAGRQAGRKTDRQTDRQTDRKTDFEIFISTVLYFFVQYSTALYYTGGGDLRGTLGPKSGYFCTESVFQCIYVH